MRRKNLGKLDHIPKGMYCYEGEEVDIPEREYRIRPCPHFKWLPPDKDGYITAYCEHVQESDCILLDDMVKICDENECLDGDEDG